MMHDGVITMMMIHLDIFRNLNKKINLILEKIRKTAKFVKLLNFLFTNEHHELNAY